MFMPESDNMPTQFYGLTIGYDSLVITVVFYVCVFQPLDKTYYIAQYNKGGNKVITCTIYVTFK